LADWFPGVGHVHPESTACLARAERAQRRLADWQAGWLAGCRGVAERCADAGRAGSRTFDVRREEAVGILALLTLRLGRSQALGLLVGHDPRELIVHLSHPIRGVDGGLPEQLLAARAHHPRPELDEVHEAIAVRVHLPLHPQSLLRVHLAPEHIFQHLGYLVEIERAIFVIVGSGEDLLAL
jgi:hypothetical protein